MKTTTSVNQHPTHVDEAFSLGQAHTPFGLCVIGWLPGGVCSLHFVDNEVNSNEAVQRATLAVRNACAGTSFQTDFVQAQALCDHIFAPVARRASDIAVSLSGTPFQVKVWQALQEIPFGAVVSYGALAAKLGIPQAARAVGTAIAANRIGYLIPCHRVGRKNGERGQFRWGAERKGLMLDWEAEQVRLSHSAS